MRQKGDPLLQGRAQASKEPENPELVRSDAAGVPNEAVRLTRVGRVPTQAGCWQDLISCGITVGNLQGLLIEIA